MPIKKDSCRISERKRMRTMAAEGYSPEQIANAVSVKVHLVEQVLSGEWEKKEKALSKKQQKLDDQRREEAATAKQREAAILGEAVARALKDESKETEGEEAPAETQSG